VSPVCPIFFLAGYLTSGVTLPPAGSFPLKGRAGPDVSALGEGYEVVQNGNPKPQGGTSAATPMFSGIISLLNEARLSKHMSPMGFLNPWLYANPGMFTDITYGWDSDNGARDPDAFACTIGWDPVTGLGSPLFPKMLASAMNFTTTKV